MEVWKRIPEYPEIEISNQGRIKLAFDKKNSRWAFGKGSYSAGYIYKPSINKYGYQEVRFYRGDKRLQLRVHRLVCIAFHGQCTEEKPMACHKDGNKLNNSEENLYWASQSTNMKDREAHGNTMRGDKHYNCILSSSDIPKIRNLIVEGISQTEIAKKYSVKLHVIHDIKRGKSWKMSA